VSINFHIWISCLLGKIFLSTSDISACLIRYFLFRMFKEELQKEGSQDIEKRLMNGSPKWFKNHIKEKISKGCGTRNIHLLCIRIQTDFAYPSSTDVLLQYPPLFPYGDAGYHTGIKLKVMDGNRPGGRENVSMTEFYAYYMHYRKNEPNPALCCGLLSQQYGVNAYSCLESSKLSFYFF